MIGHYNRGEYEDFLAPADPASVERVIGHYACAPRCHLLLAVHHRDAWIVAVATRERE